MNIKDCAARVDAIIAMDAADRDPESAHFAEDELLHDVIDAIANGETNPRGLAQEVMRLFEPDRNPTRWYA